jgi:hypothetical protein
VEDFNAQSHWAHRDRSDGRRSPNEVLSWVPGAGHRREQLEKTLTVEHAGETLSRYQVEFAAGTDKPRAFSRPVLYETALTLPQLRLFGLDSLGNGGWLKALRLEDYAPRRLRSESLQQALFPYHEAWG